MTQTPLRERIIQKFTQHVPRNVAETLEQKIFDSTDDTSLYTNKAYDVYGNLLEKKQSSLVGFDHPVFDDARREIDTFNQFTKRPFTLESSETRCNRCKQMNVYSFNVQISVLGFSAKF